MLFDKDGTLVDFEQTWRPAYDACAAMAAGADAALALELLELAGQDESGLIDPRSPLACGTLDEVWDTWEGRVVLDRAALDRLAAEMAIPVPSLPLAPVFERLKGLRLGIATMDTTAAALKTAETLGLQLDFVTGCDGGHGTKPGPGMVLAFCEAVGLEPIEVAMVGDTLHDLHAARAAGALAVAVTTGASPRELLEPHADHVLRSLAELPGLLAAISPGPRRRS
ncbi:MAG TPA: HAD-IA family hydrolase [Myxococcota bacterium]|nr:HAD-IA family hydrolase [Myxococcota bacterium]